MPEWVLYLILFPAGLLAGALNVVAGGGSFLTLPVLIFLGLPPTTANGTNRVAILFQNVGAGWSFHRHGVMRWRWAVFAALPAILGAGLGTAGAVVVGDEAFRKILAFLMILMTLWSLLAPARAPEGTASLPRGKKRLLLLTAFFGVGVYGGFVQAGVGFLTLAVTTLAGLDLVQGNAIKVFCILAFTLLSLGIFQWQGMVYWPLGLTLAAGNTLGGIAGARLSALKGHRWIRRVVTLTVIAFAIRLWMS